MKKSLKRDPKNDNEKENYDNLNKSEVINESIELESIAEKSPAKISPDSKKESKKKDKTPDRPEKEKKVKVS